MYLVSMHTVTYIGSLALYDRWRALFTNSVEVEFSEVRMQDLV